MQTQNSQHIAGRTTACERLTQTRSGYRPVSTKTRAPNKSIEEPLVNVARALANCSHGSFSRLEVVDQLTKGLRQRWRRRQRRQAIQAVISRLIAAGFFRITNEQGVLRFRRIDALLPWDAFVERRRTEAIERLSQRLEANERPQSSNAGTDPPKTSLRRDLKFRLRKLQSPPIH
jgi:hypothetical protein